MTIPYREPDPQEMQSPEDVLVSRLENLRADVIALDDIPEKVWHAVREFVMAVGFVYATDHDKAATVLACLSDVVEIIDRITDDDFDHVEAEG